MVWWGVTGRGSKVFGSIQRDLNAQSRRIGVCTYRKERELQEGEKERKREERE